MVHRNIEIPLYLRRVQIHYQCPMRSRSGQKIRHQLCRYRHPRLVLAVLPGVSEIRDHRRNAPCRCALQRVNHQQQFHQVLIHRLAGGLHHKNVCASNVLQYLEINFAIGESCYMRLSARYSKKRADLICQRLICSAAKDLQLLIMTSALRLALALGLMLLLTFLVIPLYGDLHFVSCRSRHDSLPLLSCFSTVWVVDGPKFRAVPDESSNNNFFALQIFWLGD